MANETLRLELQPREITGKKVQGLRDQGILPIGICGRGIEPYSAQVDEREFNKVINKAGYSGLIELSIPGQKRQSAFLLEVQRNSVSNRIIHADLRVVDVNQPVDLDIHVALQGENDLVSRGNAVLNLAQSVVRVRALPGDVPHQIDIDVTSLTEVGQQILVKDLNLPANVEILDDVESLILALGYPQAEEAPAEEPATEE
ncbi:50S ribosomal protein L25 [Herpetosiphon giganteus]|uniref:50S ribosomal protein L25 n=1 Tax=Herpetosiphon giganteus TaxID=2029754 RepID=UPI00195CD30C|nr:50S ribosomal protein L25 [Herpetosiphon giganteus]MBM7842807.1 large subunit ribosomal protein L25 [Herpetosiphon giganteus]